MIVRASRGLFLLVVNEMSYYYQIEIGILTIL